MTIGERIKQRRKALGLTLLQVSKVVGVGEATVQRYESGNIKGVKHDRLEAIAKVLHTTPSYLAGWDNPQERNN